MPRGGYRANAGGWNRRSFVDAMAYDPETHCWNWTGDTDSFGYGRITHNGRRMNTHRLAAMLWLGLKENDERYVLHKCDNPKCFSPHHLYIGTQYENVRDLLERKGHHYSNRSHCKNGHAFSEHGEVRTMKGRPYRRCMACMRACYHRRGLIK